MKNLQDIKNREIVGSITVMTSRKENKFTAITWVKNATPQQIMRTVFDTKTGNTIFQGRASIQQKRITK